MILTSDEVPPDGLPKVKVYPGLSMQQVKTHQVFASHKSADPKASCRALTPRLTHFIISSDKSGKELSPNGQKSQITFIQMKTTGPHVVRQSETEESVKRICCPQTFDHGASINCKVANKGRRAEDLEDRPVVPQRKH